MPKGQIIVSVLLLALLIVACGQAVPAPPSPPTAPGPKASLPAAAASVKAPAAAAVPTPQTQELEWKRVVQDAKREGTVVIYHTTGGAIRSDVHEAFKAAYALNAEFVSGPSASLMEKILREYRVGLRLGDISLIGIVASINAFKSAGILQRLDDTLILPDVINPQMWYGGQLDWVDRSTHTTLGFSRFVTGVIVANQNLVQPGEIKSWRDLLNPKWKNNIVILDPTLGSGIQVTWAHIMASEIMGWDYLRELAKQEPVIAADGRLQVEWVARGKYAIAACPRSEIVAEFEEAGVRLLRVTPVEGAYVNSGGGTISLFKDSPHPNTAKLFINWLLTKEGQTVWAQATGNPSARVDVPISGNIKDYLVPDPKIKYARANTEEFLLKMQDPANIKMMKEIFAPLVR